MDERLLISACLTGLTCQYDGRPARRQLNPSLLTALGARLVPICPEQLAGLPTPRSPAEITSGDGQAVLDGQARVLSQDGVDLTKNFVRGAQMVLYVARFTRAAGMITQKRSPSCSSAGIYDGSFSHTLRPGCGVCAALLQLHGIQTIDIDRFEEEWNNAR